MTAARNKQHLHSRSSSSITESYREGLPRYRLSMTTAIMLAMLQQPTLVFAADTTVEPVLEDVVVTAAKPMPGAVIGDIPPENQLNRADIASYGVSTINDLLSEIANQTQSDQGRDSSAAPIILVNGKRISGINEIGDFPTEAILRVDILPEEVALKYGYDAQQKVVNIILRRFFQTRVVDVTGGASTQGGGENGTADLSDTHIRGNDRMNIVARVKSQAALLESDRGVSSTAGTVSDPTDAIGNDSNARTLKPATNIYSLNGVLAHPLSESITASFNTLASYQTSRALNGFAAADLNVPSSSPFSLTDADTTVDRYLSNERLHQDIDTAKAHAGVTLNADLPKQWRLSVISAYDYTNARTQTDRGYDVTGLQGAIDAGEIDPYGRLSLSTLGSLRRQNAEATTNAGSASVLANGSIWMLPAGALATSIKLGGDFSSNDATSTGVASRTVSRTDGNVQVSVDAPLTSRSKDVLGAVGDLTANFTGGVTEVSNFGSLGTFGYGLHWTPHSGVSVIASVNEDRQAPTLDQLNGPSITTTNVRVYDYVQGKTVTISQLAGGNPDLKADDRHVFKLGATLAPVNTDTLKLNVIANYLHSVTRNAIGSLSSATSLAEQAFPDRFERDDDGTLVAIDSRAINFARQNREEVRWGLNLTKVLRAATRPSPPLGERPPGMRGHRSAEGDSQSGSENARRGADSEKAQTAQATPNTDPSAPPPPPNRRNDVPGSGPPPDSFSPDGHGQRGGGGGFGREGAGRGGSPPGGVGGGGGNGAQFQVSLYHSWYFRNDIRLNAAGPTLDLLNGGTIGTGTQPRHRIQLNAGVIDNGIGLLFSSSWTAATSIADSSEGAGTLHYSALATINLRLFADLQQRFMNQTWARGTRVTVAMGNVFNAHQEVHDANGVTPQIYQPAFVDPYGRTATLAFRRLF